jgi:hypothetical protein
MSVHRQTAALENAQESSELAQSVLAGASATLIIGFGRDGTITFFNNGAEQVLGYQAEEVVGRRRIELFHLDDEIDARARELGVTPGTAVFTAQVDAGAASERRDWTMVCRDGRRFIVSLRVTPRRSKSGEVVGYLGVGEDVTERHRAEAALREALERERDALEHLEQLDRAKTTFVSTVSHELRTPMTSILGYTDMVLDEAAGPVSTEQRLMLEAARRNGHRLLRLIEDLLTVSLIEDGTFTVETEPLDLRTVVRAGLDAVRPQLEDRRLELREELGEDEVVVLGDLHHLERVAVNLLANAVKFTPDGGQVAVRVGVADDQAFLEVSDTGVGIPTDEQGQVFQRFYRSSTAQELEIQGTGLGLSIVQTIVTSHGGRVMVASRPGGGTTARVDLPLRQPAEGLR